MTAEVCRRGTSNTNDRGSTEGRRRRREWLVLAYAADVMGRVDYFEGGRISVVPTDCGGVSFPSERTLWNQPVCRCYRCGMLLCVDTVTVDRIVPGIEGGTYRRNNIRPACARCNASTGGSLAAARKRGRR